MGPGILPETTVGKHNLQMPTKARSCKKEAICEHVQKRRRVLWAKAHLKWTVSKWKRCRVPRAKEEGDLPACHLHSVQNPASLMVWGCISAYGLHVLEGTMNVERYIKVLEQHMLPSRWRVFQQNNANPHSAAITTAWLRSRRVWVLNCPACSPGLSHIENIWHIIKQKIRQKQSMNSSAAGNLYQARMGPNYKIKTPEMCKLDAQTVSNSCEKKRRCCTMETWKIS